MKSVQPIFLFFAVLSAACIMGIGVAIAEKSVLGIAVSIIGLLITMGIGFTVKRRMRNKNLL